MLIYLTHLEELTGFGPFRLFGYTSVRGVGGYYCLAVDDGGDATIDPLAAEKEVW